MHFFQLLLSILELSSQNVQNRIHTQRSLDYSNVLSRVHQCVAVATELVGWHFLIQFLLRSWAGGFLLTLMKPQKVKLRCQPIPHLPGQIKDFSNKMASSRRAIKMKIINDDHDGQKKQ